jgi:hypothetical protein
VQLKINFKPLVNVRMQKTKLQIQFYNVCWADLDFKAAAILGIKKTTAVTVFWMKMKILEVYTT